MRCVNLQGTSIKIKQSLADKGDTSLNNSVFIIFLFHIRSDLV